MIHKTSIGEKLFDIINAIVLMALAFIFVYPFYQLLIVSLNDATDAMRGGLYLLPRIFSLESYIAVFRNQQLFGAFIITVSRTIIGTLTSLFITAMFAYGLSKRELMFRKFYNILAVITMFFSGGLIPYFIWLNSLGFVDNYLVYIIPMLISVWNMIILRTFFMQFNVSLEEAAKIDGCSYFRIFFKIVIPLSLPAFFTIGLFNAVAQWNSWFDAFIFINDDKLMPVQTILMRIINQNSAAIEVSKIMDGKFSGANSITPESIKIATMMVATIPIISLYPLIQKYFIGGIMIGSVKE